MTWCSTRTQAAFWLRAAGSLLLMTTLAAAEPHHRVPADNVLPLVTAEPVRGHTHEPIPLKILAAATVDGEPVILLLRKVPRQAQLNFGINVGAGEWMFSAGWAHRLTFTAHQPGAFLIEAQLLTGQLKSVGKPARFWIVVNGDSAARLAQPLSE